MILSPSLLSADFIRLGEQIDLLKQCGITNLHFDMMDGSYVPSISFGMPVLKSIRDYTDMVLDVHMMVEEPIRLIPDVADSGADIITVHMEACKHIDRTINAIKERGLKAGVVINPGTPINVMDEILGSVDMVLLMSVNPGFGGQKYIPYSTDKIKRLSEIKKSRNLSFSIQVDGGINASNIKEVLQAGADNIVAGSAVFHGDIADNISKLTSIMKDFS